ncbi:MAG TPA: DUF370 domain-containing protein [Clostridia bacterium]|nr:DUF370 domain-containing protein [Clostridia bacterium]
MLLVSIGFGNLAAAERICAIVSSDSAPIKRIVTEMRGKPQLVDASCGRRTRAVLFMDDGHIILSALQPETIQGRIENLQKSGGSVNAE